MLALLLCFSLLLQLTFGSDFSSRSPFTTTQKRHFAMSPETLSKTCGALQDVIGTDAGNRGMKCLIVPGDLEKAAYAITSLEPKSTVVVLSGFPCCVTHDPPTETDGPPGTFAIARAMAALGHEVIVVTDTCNEAVFAAALENLALPSENCGSVVLQAYPPSLSEEEEKKFSKLANDCNLLVACERAGPSKDGVCYTMRAIDMNEKGLIAPLHRLVKESNAPFIGIGDGGNELGMGKVLDQIAANIPRGETIGCVVPADFLIAASVSNWGGYAFAAAAAATKANDQESLEAWLERCLPSEDEEIALLNRCVAVGCRDGVSGEVEATVDGMPLETSMQCLRDIRKAALDAGS
mmetsp:Transcript_18496/g.45823  ORF Transcript_18496/g.45823 Transcript_18496/m.45823 type:complete len:351 (+) Transcript_18496:3-1055(+)